MQDFKVKLSKAGSKQSNPKSKLECKPVIPAPKIEWKPSKEYEPEVEKPSSKDYESGFGTLTRDDSVIDQKFRAFRRTTLDSYLVVLSKKLDNNFSWRIAQDACHVNIYNQDDELYQSKKMYSIGGDSYYIVFDEPATNKLKAHQALAFVDWFL